LNYGLKKNEANLRNLETYYSETKANMKDTLISCRELSYTGHVCDERRSGYLVSSLNKELPEILQYENRF
jgi:hypothetical protein